MHLGNQYASRKITFIWQIICMWQIICIQANNMHLVNNMHPSKYAHGFFEIQICTYKKVRPRTGHEGPAGMLRCSSTLSLTSALDVGGWLTPRHGSFNPGKGTQSHCIGGWVGPRVSLDGSGKSRAHRDLIPGPSSP
jgi:hypothetical protein